MVVDVETSAVQWARSAGRVRGERSGEGGARGRRVWLQRRCWVVLVAVVVLESGSGVAPVKLAESSRVRGGSRGADEGQRNAGVLTAEWARRPWSPGALEGGHGGLGAPGRASAAHDSEGARHV